MSLDLQSLSITSVFRSIVNYFKSQENNSKWKDLTMGAESSFLIRMLSNIFSNLSYRIVAQSRENYLSTLALQSSATGIAVNLGYSVFRGTNLKRLVEIVPDRDITLPKLAVIGNYLDDYKIVCLEEAVLKAGEAKKLKVVVGKIKEHTFTTGTSAVKVFSLFVPNISEDYTLYLGSQEVPTTKVIKEMTEDKYLVRTNPYSSVDIMYLNNYNNFKYLYGTGSEITIRYIELENVPVRAFTNDMFLYGNIIGSTTISTYRPFESVEDIKVNAPLDHETQNLIRSKQDYANRMRQILPSIIECNYIPITPTYTLISYLKNDLTLLTDFEKDEVLELLKKENYFGTPLPDITPPRREVADLDIKLKLSNKYKNISDIREDIGNIIDNYYNETLGATFSTFSLERRIEDLSYVSYARVSHKIKERKYGQNYQVGYILGKDDKYYMANKILGIAGSTEPNWNLRSELPSDIDTGWETQDGSIVWRAYKLLPNMPNNNLQKRENGGQYGVGDYIITTAHPNFMFKCVDLVKSSGYETPNLLDIEVGNFVVDGGIVWVAKDRSDEYPEWLPANRYKLGDSVNITSGTGTNLVSLECISYTGTTGVESNLSFELPSYNLLPSIEPTSFVVPSNKVFYFRPGDIITATYPGGSTLFSVVNSVFDGINTNIEVAGTIDTGLGYDTLYTMERGTRDGEILWTLVEDIDNLKYAWNGYVVFDYELSIIE